MKASYLIASLLITLLLQSCSGNGFHLRKELDLPTSYQRIQIVNLSYESDFVNAFEEALEESGGKLVEKGTTKITINNFREGKHTIAYTSERKAREFLLSIKFDYFISPDNNKTKTKQKHRINLDRVFIYDADFALGKAEEESKIRQNLYQEASRLILLKLQYAK
jgi:outer membrane lipopolysaccharide assembly protein LptE/RlpB